MTQPYQPPPYPQPHPYAYQVGADPRAAVKRASILMFVLAFFTLLMAGCVGAFSALPFEQLPPETRQQFEDLERQSREAGGPGLQEGARTAAIVILIPAVLLVVTGIGVRTGRRPWIVAAMIVAGLLTAFTGLQALYGLLQLGRSPAAGICALFIFIVPLALFVLLFVWLWNGYRAAGASQAATTWPQQQAGYWQYPQPQQTQYPPQQQTPYPPSGYGYGNPPPQQQQPPQPPATPPTDDPDRPPGV